MFFAKLCLLVPCLAMAMAAQDSAPASKLPVRIFYENMCPESVALFQKNFYNNYVSAKWNESMIVSLNPYGNANLTGTSSNGIHNFTCEHGMEECRRNMIHACAINTQIDSEAVLKFVNCSLIEGYYNTSKDFMEECAQRAGLNFTSINECANNKTVATETYYQFGLAFNKTGILGVPAVGFNYTYTKSVSDKALANFADAFCSYLKTGNQTNDYCKARENAASIPSVSFLTFVIASILLVKMYQ